MKHLKVKPKADYPVFPKMLDLLPQHLPCNILIADYHCLQAIQKSTFMINNISQINCCLISLAIQYCVWQPYYRNVVVWGSILNKIKKIASGLVFHNS